MDEILNNENNNLSLKINLRKCVPRFFHEVVHTLFTILVEPRIECYFGRPIMKCCLLV